MSQTSVARFVAALSAISLSLAFALFLVSTAGDDAAVRSDLTTGDDDSPYPVFWLGEEYGGHELTRIIPPDPKGWQEPTFFIYGGCAAGVILDCDPAVVVKTSPNCDPEARRDLVIRGRDVRVEGSLAVVETASGSAYIYARDGFPAAVVAALSLRGQSDDPPATPADLPGSQCAYFRVRPRTFPTPTTPEPYTPDPKAETVLSSFGALESAYAYDEAAAMIGWRPLRSQDWRYTIALNNSRVGAVRTFKGEASFEQDVHAAEVNNPIQIAQEPASNRDFDREGDDVVFETLGRFTGEFWTNGDTACFIFLSGETFAGDGIRVQACANGKDGHEPLRHFVRTLGFD